MASDVRHSSIADSVALALQAFEAISRLEETAELDDNQVGLIQTLGDLLSKFKLWAGNIGAHRTGRSSLDHRLRDSSHLRAQAARLLEDLITSLNEVHSILSGETVPWDQEQGDDDDLDDELRDLVLGNQDFEFDSELSQLADDIDGTIRNLLRLSMSFRNPAPHDHFMSTEYAKVRFYESSDIGHVQAKYPDATGALAERLGRALSQRRQYFKYREAHHLKLAQGLLDVEPIRADAVSTVASSVPLAMKDTGATPTLQVLDEDEQSDTGFSQTSFATSAPESERLRIPPIPKSSYDGPFECPFCFMFISASSTFQWKRHVLNDLRPYTCLIGDCPTPNQQYGRRHGWLGHMHQVHWKIWLCPFQCGQEYDTETSVRQHIASVHPAHVADPSLDTLVSRYARSQPPRSSSPVPCPLCQDPLGSVREYQRHVGRHQVDLALFVLPRIEDYGESDRESDPQDAISIASSSEASDHDIATTHADDQQETAIESEPEEPEAVQKMRADFSENWDRRLSFKADNEVPRKLDDIHHETDSDYDDLDLSGLNREVRTALELAVRTSARYGEARPGGVTSSHTPSGGPSEIRYRTEGLKLEIPDASMGTHESRSEDTESDTDTAEQITQLPDRPWPIPEADDAGHTHKPENGEDKRERGVRQEDDQLARTQKEPEDLQSIAEIEKKDQSVITRNEGPKDLQYRMDHDSPGPSLREPTERGHRREVIIETPKRIIDGAVQNEFRERLRAKGFDENEIDRRYRKMARLFVHTHFPLSEIMKFYDNDIHHTGDKTPPTPLDIELTHRDIEEVISQMEEQENNRDSLAGGKNDLREAKLELEALRDLYEGGKAKEAAEDSTEKGEGERRDLSKQQPLGEKRDRDRTDGKSRSRSRPGTPRGAQHDDAEIWKQGEIKKRELEANAYLKAQKEARLNKEPIQEYARGEKAKEAAENPTEKGEGVWSDLLKQQPLGVDPRWEKPEEGDDKEVGEASEPLDDPGTLPTYTRMARRHLSLETLRVAKIDYVLDETDPAGYVLVKREVLKAEQDVLWRHTRALRESRALRKARSQLSSRARGGTGTRSGVGQADTAKTQRITESHGSMLWLPPNPPPLPLGTEEEETA